MSRKKKTADFLVLSCKTNIGYTEGMY